MKKANIWLLALALVTSALGMQATARSAERVVLGEEFTATW
jgi:hypothetical protein